jgi:hypothetical protein
LLSARRRCGRLTFDEPRRSGWSGRARHAAVEALRRAAGPLKSAEIARRVLGLGGVRLAGKTPAATIAAMLAVENKKRDGLFVRRAPGTYTLRERSEP